EGGAKRVDAAGRRRAAIQEVDVDVALTGGEGAELLLPKHPDAVGGVRVRLPGAALALLLVDDGEAGAVGVRDAEQLAVLLGDEGAPVQPDVAEQAPVASSEVVAGLLGLDLVQDEE